MLGLDAAGKTTILYKLHIGEVLSTVPTIGQFLLLIIDFFKNVIHMLNLYIAWIAVSTYTN